MQPHQHHCNERPPSLTRRSAIARLATGTLLGSAIAATGAQSARAQQATPGSTSEGGIQYMLAGDGVEITCDLPQANDPRLTLQGRLGDGVCEGSRIESHQDPHLGAMVTMTIEWVADAYTLDLTLLLPRVNLMPGQEALPISTLAILTRHHSNIGGPNMVKGPLESYQAINLTGTFKTIGT